jgi:MoaA/NifB/PqqE/SkfB family radical SAM enzyme
MKTAMHKPRLIFWEVTKGCKVCCIPCRATAMELLSTNDLPTTKALNVIKQVSQLSLPILVRSGGKPLFLHGIFKPVSFARECGSRAAMVTRERPVAKAVAHCTADAGVRRVSSSRGGRRYPRCLSGHHQSI